MDEAAFIDLLRSTAANESARALSDDVAVYGDLIFTHDMMVEGVHYFADADPFDVAWKLVVRNLSDLAAKGATPLGVLLGYMLGDDAWDRRFAEGLHVALSQFGTNLWGGDTAAAAAPVPRVLGMTAIGRASHTPVPGRSGARPGDAVWIAGTVGDAFMGWRAVIEGEVERPARADDPAGWRFSTAFHRPVPRLADGAALAPQVTAIMDISDGPLLDARRMALASNATFALSLAALPFSDALRHRAASDPALLRSAASFGDDYALLFTLPPGESPRCPATRVGEVRAAVPETPLLVDGRAPDPAAPLGWQHQADMGGAR